MEAEGAGSWTYHEILILDLPVHAFAEEDADCFARLISISKGNGFPSQWKDNSLNLPRMA